MRTRLRLGAAGAVALGALLLATVLASPALAWHSTVEAEASCLPDGSVLVEFTVTPFEDGHDATVDVFYVLNDDKPVGLVSEGDLSKAISGEFDLPPGTTGTLTLVALVHWEKTGEKTKDKVHVDLPKCEKETTTTMAPTTTAPPTTAPRRPPPSRRPRPSPASPRPPRWRRRPRPRPRWVGPPPPPRGASCRSPAPAAPGRCCWPGSRWSAAAPLCSWSAGSGTQRDQEAFPDEGPPRRGPFACPVRPAPGQRRRVLVT